MTKIVPYKRQPLFDETILVLIKRKKKRRLLARLLTSISLAHFKIKVIDRNPNRSDVDYDSVLQNIYEYKDKFPSIFTRMYRLSPVSFDKVLQSIKFSLQPDGPGGKNIVPPIIKFCLGLRLLAGGSYLDLAFGYKVLPNCIPTYAMEAITAMAESEDPFLDNIKSPIHCTSHELEILESGFAKFSNNILRGTVAAGDGIVFRMIMPTYEEVDGDVISYYTRKGYYAFGLQAFCDSKCKFLSISSVLCSSSGDNTAYIVTQLAKDIKAGKLDKKYHVVMDEAYVCRDQEMTPYKGRRLSVEQDTFNYYLSLNRQVIERAFGILVQRWGILWRPLRLNMMNRGTVIRAVCRLHNICIDDFGSAGNCSTLRRQTVEKFLDENDHQGGDRNTPQYIDSSSGGRGRRSDLERSNHRESWTEIIRDRNMSRPVYSKSYKKVIRP